MAKETLSPETTATQSVVKHLRLDVEGLTRALERGLGSLLGVGA